MCGRRGSAGTPTNLESPRDGTQLSRHSPAALPRAESCRGQGRQAERHLQTFGRTKYVDDARVWREIDRYARLLGEASPDDLPRLLPPDKSRQP